MLYAAMTFWLLVVVFSAWGVHRIWSGLVRPRVVNSVLLPGTFVAQVGHVLGLLATGATINNTTLIKDDESAEPQQANNPKPKIPIIGPIVIAMLPLAACGAAIYVISQWLGAEMLGALASRPLARTLPTSLAAFWQLLRDAISLMEHAVNALRASDFGVWRTWVFLYLAVCLTVRMAPLPGNLRGAIGAILVLGLLAALLGTVLQVTSAAIEHSWTVLTFSVATLLVLLLLSLLVRGAVGLIRTLAAQG